MEQKTLREYWALLAGHDWHYKYSDSHKTWQCGFEVEAKLRHIAGQSEGHKMLFEGFNAHYNPLPDVSQAPLPPQPE